MSAQDRFKTGQIIATERAGKALLESDVAGFDLVRRHARGDWGDVSPEGREENERALKEGGPIISSYTLGENLRVWLLTNPDRTKTTIMLPDEYPANIE